MTPPARSFAIFSCVLALAGGLGACGQDTGTEATGYIEGDFLYIGPETSGRIARLAVEEGSHVDPGEVLFLLESEAETAALAAAEARRRQAEASLADLRKGARLERLQTLEAAVASAESERALAKSLLDRRQALRGSPAVSQETLDEAQARFDMAAARLEEARTELALARLPAREDAIEAALAAADAAAADALRLSRELDRRSVAAPVAGVVQEVVRRSGESVQPGSAVVVFLPNDRRRVVFFVPQASLADLNRGASVGVSCDGCPESLTADIEFISSEVEFTPPVIFGPQERNKLLVRIEARPAPSAANILKPGQPVTVNYGPAGVSEPR